MSITWIPTAGQGVWRKCKIIGNGQEIDEINHIIKRGTFNNDGKLEGPSCIVINYSDSTNVSIRSGSYLEGKEHGDVYEYVFPKSSWNNFHGTPNGVNSTRYKHTFNNGVWVSTSETINNKRIKGICSKQKCKMNNWTSFDFEEKN